MAKRRGSSRRRRTRNQPAPSATSRPKLFYGAVIVVVLAAVAFFALSQWDSGDGPGELDRLTAFKRNGSLSFFAPSGDRIHTIDIEIADSEGARRKGMMYRNQLGDNQGLLFVFPQQTELSFWMRNTPVPLDMIFADSTGDIVTIHKDAQPYTQAQYSSTKPAKWVVEVAAGLCDRYGITASDRIEWTRSDQAAEAASGS